MTSSEGESTIQDPSTYEDLAPRKTWIDNLAWYLLVMGFIGILTGGLFFWLFRSGKLRYDDFILNGNALGTYFLIAGVSCYLVGRFLTHWQRIRRRKKA